MSKFVKITLNKIRNQEPCTDGWEKLLKSLDKTKADDEPLSLLTILESTGLDDALWCLRVLPVNLDIKRKITGLKVSFVTPIIHLMKDERSKKSVEVAASFAKGNSTEEDLANAAKDAYATAAYAADAAYAAANAANTNAAYATATYAATAAAYAYAAADAARKKARNTQKEIFRLWILENEE